MSTIKKKKDKCEEIGPICTVDNIRKCNCSENKVTSSMNIKIASPYDPASLLQNRDLKYLKGGGIENIYSTTLLQ